MGGSRTCVGDRVEIVATRGRAERGEGRALAGSLGLAVALAATPAGAITITLDELLRVDSLHGGAIEHCDEAIAEGAFLEAFECGDELFEVSANAADGVGAHVGDGGRFTRAPRADLMGAGEWGRHAPRRATGPNASSCVACHQGAEIGGAGDGSGPAAMNVMRDPTESGSPGMFIQRNTPHLFGPGGLQLLAQEMSLELQAARDAGIEQACAADAPVDVELSAKGVPFGVLQVGCAGVTDDSSVEGVDADLVVRPFQWKGVEPTLRAFARGALHNEVGLQAVELTGEGVDGDGDGVVDEISFADVTAMALYLAGQPRPVTQLELNRLRLQLAGLGRDDLIAELELPALSRADVGSILRGEGVFVEVGCADCHRPAMFVEDPVFAEPSDVAGYRDDPFPAGQPALSEQIRFDLTRDLPNNVVEVGRKRFDLGNFERTRSGAAIVRLYGDLKRHDMGPGLAESIDETGHGASTWMTKELWGVGSTAQYLHDGRATTLTEAILEHGGEGAASRDAFLARSDVEQADLVRFMRNLVLFFPAEDAAAAPDRTRDGTFRRRF